MRLRTLLKKVVGRFTGYTPIIEVLISRYALLHNLHEYQRMYPNTSFAPVLKSNAYGHGLVQVAEVLDKENVAFFVLDSLYEAIVLRKNDITSNILIVGYTTPENILQSKLQDVSFTVTSLEQLNELSTRAFRRLDIHIKVDTGMHRQGILPTEISECISLLQKNNNLTLIGVCSHFADADNTDQTFTKAQIQTWEAVVQTFTQAIPTVRFYHISATAGTAYSGMLSGNVARLGLGLYGINPSPFTNLELTPALKMRTMLSSVRTITQGERVGYNGTYTAKGTRTIATIPVGYFEGVDRRLTNCGSVTVDDVSCPIVGRVSMNITSVDVTAVQNPTLSTEVTVISNNKIDANSVESIAKITGAIPWEILVHIPQHLRRTIVEE